MYFYQNYLREADIQDVRLPLLINMIKYCVKTNQSEFYYKDYEFVVNQKEGILKIYFTPDDVAERAYIVIKADIHEAYQLHEEMDWVDLVYYDFENIEIIEARYHRYDDRLIDVDEETLSNEFLSPEELKNPELVDMITKGVTDGFYYEEIDMVTKRTHVNYELAILLKDEKLEEPPEELY